MSTPAGERDGGGESEFKGQERRSGDRRSGADRRGEPERRTGISVSRSFRRQSFFDHPGWVALTVLIGIVLGVVLMSVTGLQAPVRKSSGAIDVKVVPEDVAK